MALSRALCWLALPCALAGLAVDARAEPRPVTVAAVGDVLFGRYLPGSRGTGGPRYAPVSWAAQPFAAVAPLLRAADLAFANLETPVLPEPKPLHVHKTLTFRADPARLGALVDAGFDVVSLANNHTGNLGARGAAATRGYVDNAGLRGVGAGATPAQARAATMLELGGQRIAVLARTLWQNERSTEAEGRRGAPRGSLVAHVHHRDFFHEVPAAVRALRAAGADHVIVSLHWGEEYAPEPGTWQRRAGRALIDAGASLVLGHHPHVLQGLERYRGGLIAYSLGNFLFDNRSRGQRDSAILQAALLPGGGVGAATLWPVTIDRTSTGYAPLLPDGAERRRLVRRLRGLVSATPDVSVAQDEGGEGADAATRGAAGPGFADGNPTPPPDPATTKTRRRESL